MKKRIFFVFFLVLVLPVFICCRDAEPSDQDTPLAIGNFLLPPTQRLGPILGIGQLVLDKNDFLAFMYVDYLKGKLRRSNEISLSFVYGINQQTSVYVNLPAVSRLQDGVTCYTGLRDINVQFEYAFWTRGTKTSVEQATVLINLGLVPTGKPGLPLGRYGNSGIVLGATYNHMDALWYYYGDIGLYFRTRNQPNVKSPPLFIYQAGFGANIGNPGGTILAWLVECSGTYSGRDKHNGIIDCNSGGNQILFGPTVYLATERTSVHVGGYLPVVQNLFGNQRKDSYFIALSVAWTLS